MTDHCHGCGVCCTHVEPPPFYGPNDPSFARLPQHLKDEIDAYLKSPLYLGKDIPCIWLDRGTGRCKNHEHRPDVCADFEVGDEPCREMRKKVGLTLKGLPVVEAEEAGEA